MAIAPHSESKDDETAVGAASFAILGTIFTLIYTLLYPVLWLFLRVRLRVFFGCDAARNRSCHRSCGAQRSTAVDIAVIVKKLTRVLQCLYQVAILIVPMVWKAVKVARKTKRSWRDLPIPWFIFGFLAMSAVHSLGVIPAVVAGLSCSHRLYAYRNGDAGLGG